MPRAYEVTVSGVDVAALGAASGQRPPDELGGPGGERRGTTSVDELRGRGLLEVGDDAGMVLAGPLAECWRVLAHPDALILVHHRGPDGLRLVRLGLTAAATVVHTPLAGGRHQLRLADTGEVMTLIEELAGLPGMAGPDRSGPERSGPERSGPERSRPEGSGPAADAAPPVAPGAQLDVSAADLELAITRAVAGEAQAAAAILRGGGASRLAAEQFVAALAQARAAAAVTVLHHARPRRVEGVNVGWIDCGPGGLWQLDPPNLGFGGDASGLTAAQRYRTRTPVRRVARGELLDQVRAGLPEWAGADDTCGDRPGLGP